MDSKAFKLCEMLELFGLDANTASKKVSLYLRS